MAADTPDIPDGVGKDDEPVTTTQEKVARARTGWERDTAVYKATEEVFEQAQPFIARRYWYRYKAYLDAGFTVAQAMTLLTEIDIEDDDE